MTQPPPGSWHPRAPSSSQAPSGRIGPYPILAELGRGGMGAVYRCRHPQLGRDVAVKVLLAGEHAGAKQVERFRREAQAAASLRHPHITAVHDVGQDQGRPFIVMDFVEGVSLQSRIDEAPLEPREAARVALALARALGYAHAQGVLHRDVKPSNVIVTPEGEPLLTDFGLAKRVDAEGAEASGDITVTGQFLGTPGYMPPEQASGKGGQVDRRADVYALGATLYAMLAGDHPFADWSGVAVLGATVHHAPPSLRRDRPETPRDLDTICQVCLEKDPGDRYPSALDLADDLERFLQDEPIAAQPSTMLDRLVKWTRRNRALAAVSGGALAVLLTAAAGFGLWTVRAASRAAVAEERARVDAAEEQRRTLAAAARAEVESLSAGEDGDPLGRALARLQAAQRWRALDPNGAAARRALFEAALTLGDLALETEQWGLARQAFRQAQALGVGDDQAAARIRRVDDEREADDRRRREEIETLLVRAEQGTLTAQRGNFDDALFQIVRRAGRRTVGRLSARLDEISAKLRDAEREVYLAAAGAPGAPRLDGLAEALALRAERGEDDLPAATRAVLREADRRLAHMLRGLHQRAGAQQLVAARQRSVLGVGSLTLAELICRALGRLKTGAAVPALGRYLAAEADPLRAAPAGMALARLGGAEAQRHLVRAFERFGQLSLFSRRVQPVFKRLPEAPPELRAGDVSSRWRRARYYTLRGDAAAAEREYSAVLKLDPSHTQALAERCVERGQMGKNQAALADIDRAIRAAPNNHDYYYRRGELLMLMGPKYWSRAASDAERVIRIAPELPEGWGLRGQLRERGGDLDGAEEDFGLALSRDPRSTTALVNRGVLRSRRGDEARAFNDLTRAITLNPGSAMAWSNRAVVRKRLGDPTGAEDDYDQALRLEPKLVDARVNRGHLRNTRGDLEGAIRDYESALQLRPGHETARRALALARGLREAVARAKGPEDAKRWLRLGEQALQRREMDEAFLAFSIAVRVDPTLDAAWAARGDMHARAGEARSSLQDYERALALAPLNAAAWVNRGSARYVLRQLEDARLDFDQAIRLDPRQAVAWYNRGCLRYEQGDLRGADRDLSRALKLRPAHESARVWRAVVRRWLGDLSAGRKDLDLILARNPRHDGALAHRAMIRLEDGDHAGAERDARAALKINRRASPAWLAYGVLLAKRGRKADAKLALENALRLGTTGLDAQLARSTLAELGAR